MNLIKRTKVFKHKGEKQLPNQKKLALLTHITHKKFSFFYYAEF